MSGGLFSCASPRHFLPLAAACRLQHRVGNTVRCESIPEDRLRHLALAQTRQEISHLRRLADLPAHARRYLDRLSEIIGRPVQIVSVGPDREQTILAE